MDSFRGCDLIRAISGWIEVRCLKQLPAGEACGISIAKTRWLSGTLGGDYEFRIRPWRDEMCS
jgi:hypothetical protein